MADYQFKSNFNFGANIGPVKVPGDGVQFVRYKRVWIRDPRNSNPLNPGGYWGWTIDFGPPDEFGGLLDPRSGGIGIPPLLGDPGSGGSGGGSTGGDDGGDDPIPPTIPNCPDFYLPGAGDTKYRIMDPSNPDFYDPSNNLHHSDWPEIFPCKEEQQLMIKRAWNKIFERDPVTGAYISIWAQEFNKIIGVLGFSLWDCITANRCPELGCNNCDSKDTIVNYAATRHYPWARQNGGYGHSGLFQAIRFDEQVLYGICFSNLKSQWYKTQGWTDEDSILLHLLLFILILRCIATAVHDDSGAIFEALFLSSYDKSGFGSFPWEVITKKNFTDEATIYDRSDRLDPNSSVENKARHFPPLLKNAIPLNDGSGRWMGQYVQWDPKTGRFWNWDGTLPIGNPSGYGIWKFF
jgi:hypothetical protein